MRVEELLKRGGILVPLTASDFESAIALAVEELEGVPARRLARIASDISDGTGASVTPVHEQVIVVLAQVDDIEHLSAVIGVSPTPFLVPGGGDGGVTEARALILLVTPRALPTLKDQMLPALVRFFREKERAGPLLAARSVEDVEALTFLMNLHLHQSLLVEDLLEPLQYRVYPETPFPEVVDLMVRRDLHSVPVVGEDYEFLGIITTGDAMKQVVSRGRKEEVGGLATGQMQQEPTAREIMTRSVMCVSEEQSLLEAASIMANRDTAHLPVVREGELVGFLKRSEVLRALVASSE